MSVWLHSTVLAVTAATTVAIGVAGASYYVGAQDQLAKKADRLALAQPVCHVADLGAANCASAPKYVTIEKRAEGENLSILTKTPAK